MTELLRPGIPVVVSAPSGGGKTTLCHGAQAQLAALEFSVSYTTRAPRAGERDGVDYHFVDTATFEKWVAADAFLEWAHVHGRMYGTSRAAAMQRLSAGEDVLFDIDVQGGAQIRSRMPEVQLVFVVPPSMAALEGRLRRRQNNSEAEISARLAAAVAEMQQASFYTHWIVNDVLQEATDALVAVIRAERLRRVDHGALLRRILAG